MTLTQSQKRGFFGACMLAAILIAIGVVTTFFASNYQLRLVYSAFVNLIVVLGLQVFMGNSRLTNLSHSAFMGIGAYAAAICVTPVAMKQIALPDAPWGLNAFALDPVTSAIIALIVTGIVSLAVGVFIVRMTGTGATIASLAVLVIVHSIFLYRTDIFKGNQAFFGIPQVFSLTSIVILAVVVVFIVRGFRESPWGVMLRASADDETGAAAMGVNVRRLRLIAWVLSGLILATAGIAYAYFLGTISARPFYFNHVFLTLAMLIFGGMRTVTGAVLGTFAISFGLEIVRWLETGPKVIGINLPELLGLSGIMLGLVIVLTMALRPVGVMGDREIEEVFSKR
ncbi:branched-chain amino acid ABC transporter permease [Pseudaestuariivita atlantica]|uniref:Branched-chain amino acid ABC transporter permease n=1 Tax=Pseudaestuariivita atlantica TaxID=1317121 RepID=A0A0L1JT84_9RHOB|nr:branched-chain amino acid ABC transporter permease [Pseudaestuariivita atlantica]KNG94628.1 branched-chain amino acid ABC transporter permease [Pseudaestuariivita atlantica]